MDSTPTRMNVVVAGGGVAGLETIIALRSLAGPRVDLTLVTPEREFVYQPSSVGEPFGLEPPRRYDLGQMAAHFGVDLVSGRLAGVDADAQQAKLDDGRALPYDALVVAIGARRYPAWDHAITFRGSEDAAALSRLLAEIRKGTVNSVAFVVPRGVTWPLPLYELAAMTARHARDAHLQVEVALFTPERAPLAVFGRDASAEMARAVEEAGVQLAHNVTVDVTDLGDLVIPSEETPLRYDRVVALPLLAGPEISGLPNDSRGFIPIDSHGRVRGTEAVFAAGDGTDFPVKQGGVAAQHADAIAEWIAAAAGAAVDPRPARPSLRAHVLTGAVSRFLHGEPRGHPAQQSHASVEPLWWPAHKIAARYLAPYLAAQDAAQGLGPPADRPEDGEPPLVPVKEWVEESPYGE